jgi:hypothetical protein
MTGFGRCCADEKQEKSADFVYATAFGIIIGVFVFLLLHAYICNFESIG